MNLTEKSLLSVCQSNNNLELIKEEINQLQLDLIVEFLKDTYLASQEEKDLIDQRLISIVEKRGLSEPFWIHDLYKHLVPLYDQNELIHLREEIHEVLAKMTLDYLTTTHKECFKFKRFNESTFLMEYKHKNIEKQIIRNQYAD